MHAGREARCSPLPRGSPFLCVCKQQTQAGFAGPVCLFSACPKAFPKRLCMDNEGQRGLQEPSIDFRFLPDPKHFLAVP